MLNDENLSKIIDTYQGEIRTALLIRRAEECLLDLFKVGKLFGTVHTCIGQEFSAVAVARALKPADSIFSNHRCHGHFLARSGDLVGLVGEVMGRQIGVCEGRGGSQHLHKDHFYSNGIQGGIVPVAVGIAAANKLKGIDNISVVFIGDGTLGEGVLYESLNIAARWQLPVLLICENNLYAQSTSQRQTLAGDILARAEAFGVNVGRGNTWEWPQLLVDVEAGIEGVRSNSQPLFYQIDTYRLMAHSKGDDDRPEHEIEPYRKRDPLHILMDLGHERIDAMLVEIQSEIERAIDTAEKSPFASVMPVSASVQDPVWDMVEFSRERAVESIRRGLEKGLETDSRVFLMGEDIESPYGGAFKCTLGLSDKYPDRVRNTPISEAAIVGMGNGLALSGLLPIVEIMFGDFLTLAADQWINHAAKFSWMYADKVKVPLIIRTPMGGRRGYAATHSQSLEKHFLGLPGTRVLCLHHRYSPARLYADLLADIDRPTLVIENKTLYGQYVDSDVADGFILRATRETFPMINLHPTVSANITLVSLGGVALEAEEAVMELFIESEIVVDLYLPSQLYPFDIESIICSVEHTGYLLIVEEGQGFASLASEILAQCAERLKGVSLVCARLSAQPCPIPASRPLEELYLPSADNIVNKVMELIGEQ